MRQAFSMTLSGGERLGFYEVLAPLGSGGMGEVYRALDTRLKREVAIKILPEAFAEDTERLARFEREARLLAALNHPAIATVHGLEHDGPRRFIVMELVAGETLAARLNAGPLPVPDVLRLGRQIAEGLEAAHARGVVHCDLKPANIALTPDGRVKLLDFGLARAFAPERQEPELSRSPTITADLSPAGSIFGTVSYMSPEQARGREIDKRTDIWAFGCVLYEMLTCRKAFAGETVPDTLGAIFEADPDWGALPAKTPSGVKELLRRCIQKDPNRRLRDVGDARIELDDSISGLTHELPETVSRVSRRRQRRWRMGLAAAGVLLASIAGWLIFQAKQPGAPAGNNSLAVLPFRNMTNLPEGELLGLAMADTVSVRLANVPGLQVVTPRAAVEAGENDSDFARVARRLGANRLVSGSLQRENDRYRITYRLLDGNGKELASNMMDGAELFVLQDRVADGVVRDLRLRRGARRTPTPSGLETAADQERYLQAIGLLQRYDKREGVEHAVQILGQLAQEKPQSALVQAALGRANLAMFDFTKDRVWADRAVAASDAARVLDPNLPEVDVIAGETFLVTGRSREAAEAFGRALAASPDKVDALLGLGRASEALGDDRAAEVAFEKAAKLQPSFAVFNQLGALRADRGRWLAAAEWFRKATEVAPDSYRAYSNLGGVLVLGCDFKTAIPAFRKALALRPGEPIAASNLGLTLVWTEHPGEAVKWLEAATRNAPNDFQVWVVFGDSLAESGQRERASQAYTRAIELSRGALRLNPQDSAAHAALGTSLARTGHAEEGARELETAIALDDKQPSVFADAATVAALRGRPEEALRWIRRAVDAGYCRQILGRQPEFASLRDSPEFQSIVAAPRKAAGS